MTSTRIHCTVIPAQPRWVVVSECSRADESGSTFSLHRTPVIAWLVEVVEVSGDSDTRRRDGSLVRHATAITVDGGDADDGCVLQYGDDPFVIQGSGLIYGGDDALLAHFRHRRELQQTEIEQSSLQEEASKASTKKVFVVEYSQGWNAWCEWRGRRGEIASLPVTDVMIDGRLRRGWWRPSLFPPKEEPHEIKAS